MNEMLIVIEDTSNNEDVFPTVTPWWFEERCLLIGCSKNENLKCLRKAVGEGCMYELPQPINCRFKKGKCTYESPQPIER